MCVCVVGVCESERERERERERGKRERGNKSAKERRSKSWLELSNIFNRNPKSVFESFKKQQKFNADFPVRATTCYRVFRKTFLRFWIKSFSSPKLVAILGSRAQSTLLCYPWLWGEYLCLYFLNGISTCQVHFLKMITITLRR